ncbi:MAG: ribonuclease E/G [Azospirillaceae bacterium]
MSRVIAADRDVDSGLLAAVLFVDGVAEAMEVDPPAAAVATGDIFRARVTGAVPGVEDALIVDLGNGEGFLTLRRGERRRRGETVLAQVEVPPREDKRVSLTTDLRLLGRLLIATPGRALALSRDIAGREATIARASSLGLAEGWILRGAFALASEQAIEEEAARLRRSLAGLVAEGPPGRVLAGPDAPTRLWCDWCDGTERVAPSPPRVPSWPAEVPEPDPAATLEPGEVDDIVRRECLREIALPSGGRLSVERTRALIAIDVDAGRSGGATANREAMTAAARALRLRNLAGLIVIDPVSPLGDAGALIDALRTATSGDARQVDIAPRPSRFGLLELTRARRGLALDELLS